MTLLLKTRHLRCVVSPPNILTKCTDGKHRNYDLTIIILSLWNNHYLNFNVGQQEMNMHKIVILAQESYNNSGSDC